MATAKTSFEEHLAQVEESIRKLERGDAPLEDSIDLYADAMRHLKQCHTVLEKAEKRLEVVRKKAGADEAVPAKLDDAGGVAPLFDSLE
jgi:exodeoxyribonuclease VII small subunit